MMKILSKYLHDHKDVDEDKICYQNDLLSATKTSRKNTNECHNSKAISPFPMTSGDSDGEEQLSESSDFMDLKRSDFRADPEFENSGIADLISVRCGLDSETESVISDYSEMADPVKEHLANVQIIADPFSSAPLIVQPKLFRDIGESEEEFFRRIRKMNFLSLAQEFAELKKQNASALPFDLHEERYQGNQWSDDEVDDGLVSADRSEGENDSGWQEGCDDQSSIVSKATSFNDQNPYLDCGNDVTCYDSRLKDTVDDGDLERASGDAFSDNFSGNSSILSTQKSNSEVGISPFCVDKIISSPGCALRSCSCDSRDDICRKLAFTDEDKWCADDLNASKCFDSEEGDCDLELCYVNEAAEDLDFDSEGHWSDGCRLDDIFPVRDVEASDPELMSDEVEEDILSKQAFLERKARLALAQVRPVLGQSLKSDVQKLKSTISAAGLSSLFVNGSSRQGRVTLEQMSITELQIVANNLIDRIEALNRQLLVDLLQRDDLHMVQDSMLVEIEDLTGRAREFASKVDYKSQSKNRVEFK